jgi:membrane protease subunit HflK
MRSGYVAREKDDQETIRRGRSAAIAGLVVQLLLAASTAAAAAWSGQPALSAATWHMLGGVPIWVVLVVFYGQRALERRESLAADKLATGDTASAMIFGELSDELQRARQRLTTIVSWGLPAVSLLVGGFLVAAGSLLMWRFASRWAADAPAQPGIAHPVGLLFATGAITFFAFVAGRWVSGFARLPAWRLLRGGASYLMSCFVVAALATVAAAAAAIAADTVFFRMLAGAVPLVMLVVGGEILITSLLEIYRPRKPGEIPRPAFDSRLLGLLTAPESLADVVGELIRYQFGVEVSRSWLFRLLGRAMAPLLLLGAAVLMALSCMVVVGPDEEGVVLRFGAFSGPVRAAGIHAKLPWPLETAATYPSLRVLQVSVSSDLVGRSREGDAVLWTTGDDRLAHIGREYYPAALAPAAAGGGLAVVDAEVTVQYRIRDLLAVLATTPDAEAAVAVVAQQEAGRYFASHDLDFLLSRSRATAGPALAAAIQARVDALGLGLEIVDAAVTAIQPPGGPVARAFHRQIAARQDRETIVERARRDAVATLSKVAGSESLARQLDAAILALDRARGTEAERPAAATAEIATLLASARGEAAKLIHAARGERWSTAVGQQAVRERFAGEVLAYERAPRYYQAVRFFEVLSGGLSDRRKFVMAGDEGALPILRMDFADPASALETLLGE